MMATHPHRGDTFNGAGLDPFEYRRPELMGVWRSVFERPYFTAAGIPCSCEEFLALRSAGQHPQIILTPLVITPRKVR